MEDQPKRRGRPPKERVETVTVRLLFPAFVGERDGVPAKLPAGEVVDIPVDRARHLANAGVLDIV